MTLLLFFRKEKQTALCLQIQYMVKLGDICKKVTNINSDFIGTIDYIDISSIDNKRKSIVSTQKLDFSEAPSRAKQLVLSGDILISNVRPNLNAVAMIINDKNKILVASTGYTVIRCNNNVLNKYVFFFCQYSGFVDLLVSQATGASYPAVNASIIKDTIIPLPTLEKQHQIANTLDKLQSIITHIRTQLEKLDLLVKARFVEMFGDVKLNSKGFDTIQLCKIANVSSSKRVFVEELQSYGIPFYRGTEVGALAEGKNIIPELFITEEHYNSLKSATGVPEIGDLLMPSICSDGRIWLVDTKEKFYFKDGRVLWIHPISNGINSIYLLYFLKQKIAVDYNSIASGTTFAELKIFSLKNLNLFMPSIKVQTQFADFVKKVDKSKVAMQKELGKAQTLFDSLMQEYFG